MSTSQTTPAIEVDPFGVRPVGTQPPLPDVQGSTLPAASPDSVLPPLRIGSEDLQKDTAFSIGMSLGLRIVQAEQMSGSIILVVEGPDAEVVYSTEARKMAYAARGYYGASNAGIEAYGGPSPVGNGRFRQPYRLTMGI